MDSVSSQRRDQRGATALLVVIFATLILSVITVSFIGLMVREQIRSGDDELSQSAYDAALAGVEDAKRVIATCRAGGPASGAACAAIASGDCDTIASSGVIGSFAGSEVLLQSRSGDGDELNQAYSCVKISTNTSDYRGESQAMQSTMVPLRATAPIKTARIEWQIGEESGVPLGWGSTAPYPGGVNHLDLQNSLDWNMPALMRIQMITPGSSAKADELDRKAQSGTVFVHPDGRLGGSTPNRLPQSALHRYAPGSDDTTWDYTKTSSDFTSCDDSRLTYQCAVEIEFDNEIPADSRVAFLRLSPIYKSTSFRVTLMDASDNAVLFNDAQPTVDSTGRANDVFRRIEARLSISGGESVSYPEFAIDVTNGLCKGFYVTSSTSGELTGSCDPNI